jgi:MATE family multidrug resistance protein
MALAYALASALVMATGRDLIAAAYTSDPAVRAATAGLLLLAAVFQLSDATQVATSCAIRGYKVTRRPMVIHLAAFWGLSLPLGLWLGYAPDWMPWRPAAPMQVEGFWIGLVVGLTAAAIALSLLLRVLANQYAAGVNGVQASTAA